MLTILFFGIPCAYCGELYPHFHGCSQVLQIQAEEELRREVIRQNMTSFQLTGDMTLKGMKIKDWIEDQQVVECSSLSSYIFLLVVFISYFSVCINICYFMCFIYCILLSYFLTILLHKLFFLAEVLFGTTSLSTKKGIRFGYILSFSDSIYEICTRYVVAVGSQEFIAIRDKAIIFSR